MYLILNCHVYDEHYAGSILAQVEITDEFLSKIRYRKAFFDITPFAEVDPPSTVTWYEVGPTLFELGEEIDPLPEDFNADLADFCRNNDVGYGVLSETPLSKEDGNLRAAGAYMEIDRCNKNALWEFRLRHTTVRVRTNEVSEALRLDKPEVPVYGTD